MNIGDTAILKNGGDRVRILRIEKNITTCQYIDREPVWLPGKQEYGLEVCIVSLENLLPDKQLTLFP